MERKGDPLTLRLHHMAASLQLSIEPGTTAEHIPDTIRIACNIATQMNILVQFEIQKEVFRILPNTDATKFITAFLEAQ
jgi:hypothetical protein